VGGVGGVVDVIDGDVGKLPSMSTQFAASVFEPILDILWLFYTTFG
jgi:hypothetical protein